MSNLETVLRSALKPYHKRGYEVSYKMLDHDQVAEVSFMFTGRVVAFTVVPSNNVDYVHKAVHNLSVLVDTYVAASMPSAADTPPWEEAPTAASKLKAHADACSAKADRLDETLDNDAISNRKVFQAMRKASASRAGADIVGRLVGGWNKHTDWHFSTTAPCGTRINFWPSTCKAQAHIGDGEFSSASGTRNVTQFLRNFKVMK